MKPMTGVYVEDQATRQGHAGLSKNEMPPSVLDQPVDTWLDTKGCHTPHPDCIIREGGWPDAPD